MLSEAVGRCPTCRALRVTALLSARVDLFEQTQVEWNQSGKPSTTVQPHATLVDSAGRLLWSAAGSETAEGPYHDPNAATLGVNGSGLNTEPVTGQGRSAELRRGEHAVVYPLGDALPARQAARDDRDLTLRDVTRC